MNPTNLIEKYRPSTLSEVAGQPYIVHHLSMFAESPYSAVFLFEGYTGTGKSSAAMALANDIGIKVDRGVFSGLWQIASGDQTGETVKETMENLRITPFEGSGWRMLIVNEADIMTAGAAAKWLDALENLPPRTIVVFTTNNGHKLPKRFRDRCECFAFKSDLESMAPYLQEMIDRVWAGETGSTAGAPRAADLGLADENGQVSFRRLVQLLVPKLRDRGRAGPTKEITVAPCRPEEMVADPWGGHWNPELAKIFGVPTLPAGTPPVTIEIAKPANKRHHTADTARGEEVAKSARAAGTAWLIVRKQLVEMGLNATERSNIRKTVYENASCPV
jgi:hypothetical protein